MSVLVRSSLASTAYRVNTEVAALIASLNATNVELNAIDATSRIASLNATHLATVEALNVIITADMPRTRWNQASLCGTSWRCMCKMLWFGTSRDVPPPPSPTP
jgi:hypothetical protein